MIEPPSVPEMYIDVTIGDLQCTVQWAPWLIWRVTAKISLLPARSLNQQCSLQSAGTRRQSFILLKFKNVIILQSIQYWNNHSCWPAAHCLASAGPFSIYRSKWFSIEAARLRGDATCNLREVWIVIITEKAFSWLKAATTAFTFKNLWRYYAKRALTPR